MFQSFTGSSRRPRQVNLSGRNVNPFASSSASGRQAPHGYGAQNTLAIAQQERLLRQQERDRLNSARLLQRTWRGYLSRRAAHNAWRAEWDINEQTRIGMNISFEDGDVDQIHKTVAYSSLDQCRIQLRLLLLFFEASNDSDALRLLYLSNALRKTLEEVSTMSDEEGWTSLLARLAKITLRLTLKLASLTRQPRLPGNLLLRTLCFLIDLVPRQMARLAEEYYTVMTTLTIDVHTLSEKLGFSTDQLVATTLALLQPITADTSNAYEWFARKYLTIPDLGSRLGQLDIASKINYRLLAKSLDSYAQEITRKQLSNEDLESRLWLLAYFIYFRRSAVSGSSVEEAPEPEFVKVVSNLLNSLASFLSRRLEPEDPLDNDEVQQPPLHPFIEEQISSLVNQSSITGLLYKVRPSEAQGDLTEAGSFVSEDAKALASYALTLLRVFPRRGDDIRMWLYLGSTTSLSPSTSQPGARMPAIKYFWKLSSATDLFANISRDSNGVLPLLRSSSGDATSSIQRDQDWTIILLFLELYTFLLKVMDDEEFFSNDSVLTGVNTTSSWTRESALSLKDVKFLTLFLKNLGFTLYWNAADLNETQELESTGSIMKYFSPSSNQNEPLPSVRELEQRNKEKGLPGVTGIPLDYFRGLVTGLLRMIHERE
jgi:ubiquitin-protein ligase E3 C